MKLRWFAEAIGAFTAVVIVTQFIYYHISLPYLGSPPDQHGSSKHAVSLPHCDARGLCWRKRVFVRQRLLEDQIQYWLDTLDAATIIFNPPHTIPLGQARTVDVRIALHPTSVMYVGLLGDTRSESAEIKISKRAIVTMVAVNDAFTIAAKRPEEQLVPDHGYAEWIFSATPLRGGDQTLELQVQPVLYLPGEHGPMRSLPQKTFDRIIYVSVPPAPNPVVAFFSNWENLRWAIGGVAAAIGAAVAFFFVRWLGKRDQAERPPF